MPRITNKLSLYIINHFLLSGPREPDDPGGTNASRAIVRASRRDAIHDLSEASSPKLLHLLAVCQFVVGLFYRVTRATDIREPSLRILHRKERANATPILTFSIY